MKVSKTGLKPVFGFPRKPVLTSLIVVEGHCTSCFIGVACFSCRRHVDVHKEGISFRWTGVRVVKALHFLVDVINGWPLKYQSFKWCMQCVHFEDEYVKRYSVGAATVCLLFEDWRLIPLRSRNIWDRGWMRKEDEWRWSAKDNRWCNRITVATQNDSRCNSKQRQGPWLMRSSIHPHSP